MHSVVPCLFPQLLVFVAVLGWPVTVTRPFIPVALENLEGDLASVGVFTPGGWEG
jgi:hypothetical protein